MRHMWPHMHSSASEMSRQNKKKKDGGSHAAQVPLDKARRERVNPGGAGKLDTLVTCVSLCGGSGKLSVMKPGHLGLQ